MSTFLPISQPTDTCFSGRALRRAAFLAGLGLLSAIGVQAQTASTYQLTSSSTTFTPLSGGTAVPAIYGDDVVSGTLPIGFDFPFEGVNYSTFQVSSNGLLGFSGNLTRSFDVDFRFVNANEVPLLAPFWGDLDGRTGGTATYSTTGIAPNRVLTMEWLNWGYYNQQSNVISFQVRLYETSGRIDYIYRPESGTSSRSTLIGLEGSGQDYFSLSNYGTAPTPAVNSSVTTTVRPAAGQMYTLRPSKIWTGAVSSAWDVPGNWNDGVAPTATSNVSIPVTTNQPRISGPQVCANLSLSSGATLTLATNASSATVLTASGSISLLSNSSLVQQAGTELRVATNLTNAGANLALDPASRINFRGTSASGASHTLTGTGTMAFQNLSLGEQSVGEQLLIQAPATVQRLLALNQSAQVTVATNFNASLTLLSNPVGTAQLLKGATGGVAGLVTVQRYITPTLNSGAGYRHYSAPILDATTASLSTAGFTPTLNTAYNSSATPNLLTPFPTVLGYDQTRIGTVTSPYGPFDVGFFSPGSGDALVNGRGYTVNIPASETVAFTGRLANDDVTVANLQRGTDAQSGWHLLGNPYASVLDMDVVVAASTGLDNAVYVYQSTGQYAGAYQSYVRGVGTAQYVGSGQGFFMRTTAASTPGTFTVTNAARVATYTNPTFQRAAAETRPLVQLDLLQPTTQHRDAAYVYFETGATAGFDSAFDALKLPSGNFPSVALTAPTQALSISGLPALGTADVEVPLTVAVPTTGTYVLEAARLLNLPTGKSAYLRDTQTGSLIDLQQQPTYSFSLNAAFTGPRFSLLITGSRVLAVAPASLTQQVAVYPNPAHGTAQVELPASLRLKPLTLTLINTLGQNVRTVPLPASAEAHQFSLTGVAPGVYSVRLATSEGLVTKRLVIE
jgi:hypothetical protein